MVMDCGQIMLENGGEVHRVEETMCHICACYPETRNAQAVANPTSILFSFETEDRVVSRVVRIMNRGIDLNKVAMVNDLSRHCDQMSLDSMERAVARIRKEKTYPRWLFILASGLGPVGFGIFFGGSIPEIVCIFLVGLFAGWITTWKSNQILVLLVASFFCTILPILAHRWLPGLNLDIERMVVSDMTLLAPGVPIVDSIRDTLSGDYLAGLARGAEAFLFATAIAVGVGIAMVVNLW